MTRCNNSVEQRPLMPEVREWSIKGNPETFSDGALVRFGGLCERFEEDVERISIEINKTSLVMAMYIESAKMEWLLEEV